MKIYRYEVDICDGCMNLEGEECHTPGCSFIWLTTEEIKMLTRRLGLRYDIEGEIHLADPVLFVCDEEDDDRIIPEGSRL